MNLNLLQGTKKITTKVSSGIQNKVSAGEAKPDFTHRNYVVAYIDGSYNKGTNTVGAGGVIFLNGTRGRLFPFLYSMNDIHCFECVWRAISCDVCYEICC